MCLKQQHSDFIVSGRNGSGGTSHNGKAVQSVPNGPLGLSRRLAFRWSHVIVTSLCDQLFQSIMMQVCVATLVRTSNILSASRACVNSSANFMHVPAALCVSLSSWELLSLSTSLGRPLFYAESMQLRHFYPLPIRIPLSVILSISASTEELSMSEIAVWRIWTNYLRTPSSLWCGKCGPRAQCGEVNSFFKSAV